ncbi:MAG: hypothetical protein IKO61_12600 [Lachnospiraceae bacterium]|nr:hypothetical protein [Lachnospiraceae bacterium]
MKAKKYINNIKKEEGSAESLKEYIDYARASYMAYAAVDFAMNYYTMSLNLIEREEDGADYTAELKKAVADLEKLVGKVMDGEQISDADMALIRGLRSMAEKRIAVLTSYVEHFDVYEYVLNRVEFAALGGAAEVDREELCERIVNFIFKDKDQPMIMDRMKNILAQLPVRMTKQRFCDILSNALDLYKGADKTALESFAEMFKGLTLISKPEGFEEGHEALKSLLNDFKEADYATIDGATFKDLQAKLDEVVADMDEESSDYILLTQLINSAYVMLISTDVKEQALKVRGYSEAVDIIHDVMNKTIDVEDGFYKLEGVPEELAEETTALLSAGESLAEQYEDTLKEAGLTESFKLTDTYYRLMSTSYFASLDEEKKPEGDEAQLAAAEDVEAVKKELTELVTAHLSGMKKQVKRAVMAAGISAIPVFFNSVDEIRNYVSYVLDSVNDAAELHATRLLIDKIIDADLEDYPE